MPTDGQIKQGEFFVSEKVEWEKQFVALIEKCFTNPIAMAEAFNGSNIIKNKNTPISMTNPIKAEQLDNALEQIHDKSSNPEFTEHDTDRVFSNIAEITGALLEDIKSKMDRRDVLRTQAAVFHSLGVMTTDSNGVIFNAYKDITPHATCPKNMDEHAFSIHQEAMQADYRAFINKLKQLAKPIILNFMLEQEKKRLQQKIDQVEVTIAGFEHNEENSTKINDFTTALDDAKNVLNTAKQTVGREITNPLQIIYKLNEANKNLDPKIEEIIVADYTQQKKDIEELKTLVPSLQVALNQKLTVINNKKNGLTNPNKSTLTPLINELLEAQYPAAIAVLEDRLQNLQKNDPYKKLGQKMLAELKSIKKETDSALEKGKTPNVTLAELTRAVKSVHATLDPTLIKTKAPERIQNASNMLKIINQLGGTQPKKAPTPSWKRNLAILGLVVLGVAAIAASVALAIGTYGAASPLSVIGFKLGLSTLATAGILAAKVTVAAAATYGAYKLFQPAKPTTEKLKESAQELEAKINPGPK